jgi:hypothetical protein
MKTKASITKTLFAMTIMILVGASGPVLGQEQTRSSKDPVDKRIDQWIEKCREHFDVKPFIELLLGVDEHDGSGKTDYLKLEEARGVHRSYLKSGVLSLPTDRPITSTTRECLAFVEGMISMLR